MHSSLYKSAVCTWFGIVCNEDKKSVIKIELPRVQLSGTISAELGILSNLQQIDLSENELFGTIPGDFRELDKLEKLSLGYNHLEGPLEEFHPFLLELNVTHNDLNGPITEDFGFNGGNFKVIDASYNRIGGVIPRSIGNFDDLTFLDFGNNEVSLHEYLDLQQKYILTKYALCETAVRANPINNRPIKCIERFISE